MHTLNGGAERTARKGRMEPGVATAVLCVAVQKLAARLRGQG
ncbi:hypothetical protein [Methylobacterium komagatae]